VLQVLSRFTSIVNEYLIVGPVGSVGVIAALHVPVSVAGSTEGTWMALADARSVWRGVSVAGAAGVPEEPEAVMGDGAGESSFLVAK
jgi:hypothetical protein